MGKHTLLRATMGSHAYGLAREGSDVDTLGVFAYDTRDLWKLSKPQESIVQTEPDVTLHEVEKFCRLAAVCNPTILELLWVDEEWIVISRYAGERLRQIRESFLSRTKVRDAFGGYAMQQMKRLEREVRGTSRPEKRAKHSRHCFRLLNQGRQLLESGTMQVKVANPEDYFKLDDMLVSEVSARFYEADAAFQEAAEASDIPEEPDINVINEFLSSVREKYL